MENISVILEHLSMLTDSWVEDLIMGGTGEPLYCILEINIRLDINYTSIRKK